MDYSETNGLIALGGTEGNIIIIDCAALKVVNSSASHSAEIIQIFFYDDQHQIISIAKNGTILIWDTHEMKILQSYRDEPGLRYSMFDIKNGRGTLYTTTQHVKQYHSKVDPEIELKALQVKILSKDFKNTDPSPPLPSRKKSLLSASKTKDAKNSNVLVTENSSLVFVSFLESHNYLITIDSKNLVRLWDLVTGDSHSSYNVQIEGQVTAANIDKTNGLLAVGNDNGQVKI